MSIIKFTRTTVLEVVEDFDEDTDEVTSKVDERFDEGEMVDVEIINEHKEFINIQFADGSVSFGVPRSCFEIVPIKTLYIDGCCPDCNTPIPDEMEDGGHCSNCEHVFMIYNSNKH